MPRVVATRAGRHRRRGISRRRSKGGWWTAIKVAFLVERFRHRRSSPSLRQIALVVVSAGLAILLIRTVSRKAKSRAGEQAATQNEAGQADDDAVDAAAAPATARNDPATGSERRLTDRVQQEMSRRADAPTQAGGAGAG